MAAGFDALHYQDLRACMFRRTRLGERSHLAHDDDLGIAQPLHQRKRYIPKQTHDGDAEFDARKNLASSRARSVAAGMRLTPKRCTRARKAATSDRINVTGARTMPRKPKPPAFVTAATSSDRATPPIPAKTIG